MAYFTKEENLSLAKQPLESGAGLISWGSVKFFGKIGHW